MVRLEDFRYNRVNMTAFRLVDSTSERVRALLREMEEISPIGRAILNQSQVSLGAMHERCQRTMHVRSDSTLGVRYTATQLKSCDLLQKLAC